jgi:hypothetical protein
MSATVKLIIGGWLTTLAMIGVCAFLESCELLKIGQYMPSILEGAQANLCRTGASD